MHKSEYIEYLRSDDWRERRKELMDEAGWICNRCPNKATQLHHLNYDSLGEEILGEDVEALCKDCHNEEHGKGEYGYEEYRGW